CLLSCSSDADCVSGDFCEGSRCFPLQGQGSACAAANECASGFCVEGVCCDRACDGACQACTAALTGGANGVCAPAMDGGVDPRGLCAEEAASTCGTDGTCQGGACHHWPSG